MDHESLLIGQVVVTQTEHGDSQSVNRLSTTSLGTTARRSQLDPGHLSFELGEAHGAEIERAAVKCLEIEAFADPVAGLLSDGQPGSLTDLVADGLAGPAEVSIHLASQEGFGLMAVLNRKRQHQFRLPALAPVIGLVRRDR